MAVRRAPHRAVTLDVDQLEGRHIGVLGADRQPGAAHELELARGVLVRDAGQAVRERQGGRVHTRIGAFDQRTERAQALAEQRHVGAGVEVRARPIGRIGAGDEHPRARAPTGPNHPKRGLAHPPEAHLRQEVEIVLVQEDEVGLHRLQLLLEFLRSVGQHCIEHGDPVSATPQRRRGLQRRERRIGLAALQLLMVEAQVVSVSDENRQHSSTPGWSGKRDAQIPCAVPLDFVADTRGEPRSRDASVVR